MLDSTRIQVDRIKLQQQINKIPEMRDDEPEVEVRMAERRVLVDQLNGIDEKLIAAYMKEDKEAQAAMALRVETDGMTPELREFRDVAQKTDFETYFKAAVLGAEIREGAEFEYNKHVFGNEWGIGDIPLEMFLDRDEHVEPEVLKHVNERWGSKEYEKRTAITGTANDTGSLTYVDRLFSDSDGAYLGTSYPAVGPGRHSFPIVSSAVSTQAQVVARGTQQTPAGGITIVNADPESIRAAFTIANVDELVLPGIGNYLMSDIRAHLMSGLDAKVIVDAVAALTGTGIAVDDSVAVTLAKVFTKFGQAVNGVAAKTVEDVRMLVGTAPKGTTSSYSAVSGLSIANVGHFFNIMAHARFRGSPHFAIPDGDNKQFAIAYRSAPPRGTRGIVAPVWRRVNLLRDPFREADRDQTSFRGTLYADVVIASTQQHQRHVIKTS